LTLRLTGPAPTGGMTVYLTSSAPGVLPVPASIFFPAGTRELRITARGGVVGSSLPVLITASDGRVTERTTITVLN
jgi:hypothetical protein